MTRLTEHARQRCALRGLREVDAERAVASPFASLRGKGAATLYIGRGLVDRARWSWIGAMVRRGEVVTVYECAPTGKRRAMAGAPR